MKTSSDIRFLKQFSFLLLGALLVVLFTALVDFEASAAPIVVPDGFALIPAGTFQMGDSFGEGSSAERPVHTVNVSEFYMGKYEVTKAQWDTIRTWGLANGYTDLPMGGGNSAAHSISWYAIVKWCNAFSQRDGLAPSYTVDGATYKTGSNDSVACNWAASGYRLPTEAEWEKAARGGLSGMRFPWGNSITHSQANYYSSSEYSYDTSSTRGYHPTYSNGSTPYSSPVGSFASNGYGLYDIAGNMSEWCWDWYDGSYYASPPDADPRGPSSGTLRMRRGGSWNGIADSCRVADRNIKSAPSFTENRIGFRICRALLPYPEIVVETANGSGLISGTASVDFGNVAVGASKTLSFTIQNTGNGPLTNLGLSLLPASPSSVFINEIHYDNLNTDEGEFIEIAGTAGVNLAGWQLISYNGSGGTPYATQALSGVIPNQMNGYGTLQFSSPGLQNGAPDGIVLYDTNRSLLVEFISYEGVMTGTSGVAAGITSSDIGVSEAGSEPVGRSLQKRGSGVVSSNFTWAAPSAASPGSINSGQQFTPVGSDYSVNSSAMASSIQSNGTTTYTVTFTPSTTGNRSNQISITSNDADENPFKISLVGTGITPSQGFASSISAAGLAGANALASATPFNDGVKNLLKYAFNLNLSGPDVRVLAPGTGTLGLPSITSTTSGATTTMRVEFIRRIGSGLVYTPKRSSELSGLSWVDLTDVPTVTDIDTNWQRVVYEEPLPTTTNPKCFGVVEVKLP